MPSHPRWRALSWLMTSIDQHGWRHDAEPLSARAVRARLAVARTRVRPEMSSALLTSRGKQTYAHWPDRLPAGVPAGSGEVEARGLS